MYQLPVKVREILLSTEGARSAKNGFSLAQHQTVAVSTAVNSSSAAETSAAQARPGAAVVDSSDDTEASLKVLPCEQLT